MVTPRPPAPGQTVPDPDLDRPPPPDVPVDESQDGRRAAADLIAAVMLLIATLTYLARLVLGLAQPGYAIVARDFGSLLAAIIAIIAGMMLVVGAKPPLARLTGALGAGALFLFDSMNLTGGFVDDVIGKYGRWAAIPTVVTTFLAIVALYWGSVSKGRRRRAARRAAQDAAESESAARQESEPIAESSGVIGGAGHEEGAAASSWRSFSEPPIPQESPGHYSQPPFERQGGQYLSSQSGVSDPFGAESDPYASPRNDADPYTSSRTDADPYASPRSDADSYASPRADSDPYASPRADMGPPVDERSPQSRQQDSIAGFNPSTPAPFTPERMTPPPVPGSPTGSAVVPPWQVARNEPDVPFGRSPHRDTGAHPFAASDQRPGEPGETSISSQPTAQFEPVRDASPPRLGPVPRLGDVQPAEPAPAYQTPPPGAPAWQPDAPATVPWQAHYDGSQDAGTQPFGRVQQRPEEADGPAAASDVAPQPPVPERLTAYPEPDASVPPARRHEPEDAVPSWLSEHGNDTATEGFAATPGWKTGPFAAFVSDSYVPGQSTHADHETPGEQSISPADQQFATPVPNSADDQGEAVVTPPASAAEYFRSGYASAENAIDHTETAGLPAVEVVDHPTTVLPVQGTAPRSPAPDPQQPGTAVTPPQFRSPDPESGPRDGVITPDRFGGPDIDAARPGSPYESHETAPMRASSPQPFGPPQTDMAAETDESTWHAFDPPSPEDYYQSTPSAVPAPDGYAAVDPPPNSPAPQQFNTPANAQYPVDGLEWESLGSHATEVYRPITHPGLPPAQAIPPHSNNRFSYAPPDIAPAHPNSPPQQQFESPDRNPPYAAAPNSEPYPSNPTPQPYETHATEVYRPVANHDSPHPGSIQPPPDNRSPYATQDSEPYPSNPTAWQPYDSPAAESPGTTPIPAQQRARQPVIHQPGGFLSPPPVDSEPIPTHPPNIPAPPQRQDLSPPDRYDPGEPPDNRPNDPPKRLGIPPWAQQ